MHFFLPTHLALALVFTAAIAPAQDAAAAIRDFKRAFDRLPKLALSNQDLMPPERGAASPAFLQAQAWAADREAALEGLRGFHGQEIAELLLKTAAIIEKDLHTIDKQRDKMAKRAEDAFESMTKALKGDRLRPGPAPPGWVKFYNAQLEMSFYRGLRDGLEAQAAGIRKQIATFDAEATRWALGEAIGSDKLPFALELELTRRAASLGDAFLPVLAGLIDKAKAPSELAALVEAIGSYKAQARAIAAEKIVPLLAHEDEGVRERAALALSHIAVPEAIEPMVQLLARERGLMQRRIARALEILTRQQHGVNAGAWQRWFAAEGADYANGSKELGGGKPSDHAEFNKKNYYYGVPQDGKAILYVIDCSGSMVVSYKNPQFRGPENKDPVDAKEGEVSRMDACRQTLSEAIGQLTGEQRFNILWYNHEPHLWEKEMRPATPDNIRTAQDFLKTLRANSGTNIYDAMQLAFDATGRGSYDKAYSVETDMIFLLTDGKPTLTGASDGEDLPEAILNGVRRWNVLGRVAIHTIGIGKDLNDDLLRKLAEENGGVYKKEE